MSNRKSARTFETHNGVSLGGSRAALNDLDSLLAGSAALALARSRPVELVPLRDLKPARRNARTHSKKQIKQIANSILRFGWTYPILVDGDFCIIAGMGRYEAAKQPADRGPAKYEVSFLMAFRSRRSANSKLLNYHVKH